MRVEALSHGIILNPIHFIVQEEIKRGRPKTDKPAGEPKEKAVKGRPKKEKKVLQIDGEQDDLFAKLVANNVQEPEIALKALEQCEDEQNNVQELEPEIVEEVVEEVVVEKKNNQGKGC